MSGCDWLVLFAVSISTLSLVVNLHVYLRDRKRKSGGLQWPND